MLGAKAVLEYFCLPRQFSPSLKVEAVCDAHILMHPACVAINPAPATFIVISLLENRPGINSRKSQKLVLMHGQIPAVPEVRVVPGHSTPVCSHHPVGRNNRNIPSLPHGIPRLPVRGYSFEVVRVALPTPGHQQGEQRKGYYSVKLHRGPPSPPNARTERCGRPSVPESATDVARPHSLPCFCWASSSALHH